MKETNSMKIKEWRVGTEYNDTKIVDQIQELLLDKYGNELHSFSIPSYCLNWLFPQERGQNIVEILSPSSLDNKTYR